MKIRKTESKDISAIMEIINQAKAYFKSQGVDQWQTGYPNAESIQVDIDSDESYVLLDEDIIVGTSMLSFGREATYDMIEGGEWLTAGPSAVIHRLAIDDKRKGQNIAGVLLACFEKICVEKGIISIKIDTHKGNKSMQEFLKKQGFTYCGVIYLEDGAPRVAFEKVLAESENY